MARNRKLQNRIGLPHITDEAEAAIASQAVVTAETVEDFVGGMLDGTETFISVSYDDIDGNLDFVVPVKDEDNMASNSSTYLSTQQSIKTYVDTEVAGIVDSSPATLNTLNELAAALGDDANYATTTTTALGNRLRTDTNSQGLSSAYQVNALTNLGITASKTEINILDGGLTASDIPNLDTSKLTSGILASARIGDNTITAGKLNVSGNGTIAQFLRSDSDGSFTWAVPTDTNTQLTQEQVEDYIYGLLTSGSNITLNYIDAAGTLTISSQDTTYTSSDFTHNNLLGVSANEHIDWTGIGAGTIHSSNYTNTTYSVGDGGLTQNNFTNVLKGKLDGVAASANNYSISSDLLDEDNMISNSITKVATQQSIKAYVDAEVTGLIDSSPATLNTLNELAAALGDDASFSTTIATSIGTKLAKASNLSDLANVGTARTNLGLGTAATLSGTGAVADANIGLVTGDVVFDYIAAQGYGVGDITSVVAGTGLSGGSTSGVATLNLQLSELAVSLADGDGDYFIVNDTLHASKRLTKANINLSGFNNDSGFATLTGSETLSNKTLTTPNLGTPSALVLTNATGAPTWNQSTTGTAAGLTTSRTLASHGDVVWNSGAFNGTGNITGQAVIQVDAVDIPMLSATGIASSSTYLRGDNTWTAIPTQLTLLDQDDMISNSATAVASQQSIKAYVDTELASLVDVAPAALNTLNELAAALGDDASFSSTITTSIGTKLAKASNLSDLANAGTARTNLGLGTASTLSGTGAVADANAGLVTGNVVFDYIAANPGGIASLAADTTPQLGGDLDTNGNAIISALNADIHINPNGTGSVLVNYANSANTFAFQVGSNANNVVPFSTTNLTTTTNAIQASAHVVSAISSGIRTTGFGTKIEFRLGEANYGGYVAGIIGAKMQDTGNANFDMFITPSGTGNLGLGNFTLNADQSVGLGQDNYVMTYDNSTGLISLEAANAGATVLGGLTDVSMDITNFVDSLLIQTDSNGSAPTTGTLNSATDNIGIGKDVFAALTSGDSNTFIGNIAGDALTSGSYNTGIGKGALSSITTTTNNTAVGFYAGQGIGNGGNNTAIGADVLRTANAAAQNTAVGASSQKSNTGGNSNTSLGYRTLYANTSGLRNIAIGIQALDSATTESDNIAIGYEAMYNPSGGQKNTAIGNYSLDAITSGNQNIAIGHYAGSGITTSNQNIAIGVDALKTLSTGSRSIAIGYEALKTNTGGVNTAIGWMSMSNEGAGQNNVAIGDTTMQQTENANENVVVGNYAGYGDSSGAPTNSGNYNTAIGHAAMRYWKQGHSNTALGYNAYHGTSNTANGNKNIALGWTAGNNLTSGSNNVVIGAADVTATGSSQLSVSSGDGGVTWVTGNSAGVVNIPGSLTVAGSVVGGASDIGGLTDVISNTANFGNSILISSDGAAPPTGILSNALGNVGLGTNNLTTITSADYNVALGYDAGKLITTGGRNVMIGEFAGDAQQTGTDCVLIGARAGRAIHDRSSAVMIGRSAGENAQSSGVIFIGNNAGQHATSDQKGYNIAIGSSAGKYGSNANYSIFMGYAAGEGDSINTSNNDNNTGIGHMSLTAITTGDNNLGLGYRTLNANTTGSRNLAIGNNALDLADAENDNIAIGYDALGGAVAGAEKNIAIGNYSLDALTSGDENVALGYNAGTALTTGYKNIAIGAESMITAVGGNTNTAVGYYSLHDLTSGTGNTAFGYYAGDDITTGTYNVSLGTFAGGGVTTGHRNISIGDGTMQTLGVDGDNNIAVGYQAGFALSTGNKNMLLGTSAGDNITTGSYNVVIGMTDVTATGDNQLSISSGGGAVTWLTGTSAGVVNIPGSLTVAGSAVGGATAIDGLTDGVYNDTLGSLALGSGAMDDGLFNASWTLAVGKEAGADITTGFSNLALGYQAGKAITTGGYNVMIGAQTGVMNAVTGSYNVGIGLQSLRRVSSGTNNIGIGGNTLESLTTGHRNIALGKHSMKATTGNDNIAIGDNTLFANTTGTRNIGIGTGAYNGADTESDNIAIGYDALGGAIAGGQTNLAIGNYAGDAITSGSNNILLGQNAGGKITTSGNNIVIGKQALDWATTGWGHNIVIGMDAMGSSSTTGGRNIAIGSFALSGNTSDYGNVAIGYNALGSSTSHYNTAVGDQAGKAISSGNRNTIFGWQAAYALTIGSDNITIGKSAGDNITSGSGNVVIGQADVASATGSDQLSISSGDGTPVWITGDSSGVVDFPNGFTNNGAGESAASANPMFTNKVGTAAKYYPAGYEHVISNTQRTHSIITTNTYFYPFRADYTGTVTGLSIYTTGFTQPNPSTVIVAVYDSDSDGAPQTRLGYNTFTTSGVSSGTHISDTLIDDSYDTTAGQIYWMAFTATGGTVGLYGWDRKPMRISSTQSGIFYYNYMRFTSGGVLPAATVNTGNLYQGNQASMPNVIQTYSGL